MSRVLCFGTFDGFHPGHDAFLREAATHGEEVWVVLARDVTVVHVKGQLPAMNEEDRLRTVAVHPVVTQARLGYPDDKYRVIEEINPKIIVLGYDQRAFTEGLAEELARRGHQVEIHRAKPYQEQSYKSSMLRPPVEIVQVSEDEDFFPF